MKKNSTFLSYLEGWLSIVINIVLFILKYWVGIVTGSIAIIADAWHTLSDSISSVIVLLSTKISTKPADKEHPFGHGRVEMIASIIIGVLLAIIAFNFLKESILKLINQEAVTYGTFAIVVTVISIVLKETMAQFAFWSSKKTGANVLKADAWHHRSDAISSFIILIGISFANHLWWIDGILGIMVAILIIHLSYKIINESTNTLLGKEPDKNLINEVKKICQERISHQISTHHFHIHEYGYHSELTFHMELHRNTSLEQAHSIASIIEKEIKDKLDIETTIHLEPNKKNT